MQATAPGIKEFTTTGLEHIVHFADRKRKEFKSGPNREWAEALIQAVQNYAYNINKIELQYLLRLGHYPVSMEEFMFSKKMLNRPRDEIYPVVLDELCKINNPDGCRVVNKYTELCCTGGIGPLSAATEFLTPTGWVRMDSYLPNMQVAEYNTTTGQAEFREPKSYEVRDCDGFYHFKTKYGVDMVLSPKHRVLFRTSRGNLQVQPAEEIARHCRGSKFGFRGGILTTFKAPKRAGVLLSDAQIQLMVAVQADGSFHSYRLHSPACRISLKKERKKVRLREILDLAGVEYGESDNTARDGFTWFYFNAPIRSKDFEWAWECTQDQLQVIVDEVLHWDGSHSDNRYATANAKAADFVQYATACCGLRASLFKHENNGSLSKGKPKDVYRVGRSDRTEPTLARSSGDLDGLVTEVPSEDGKMYCFATETGFFIARHNGQIFITGNSAKTTTALYTIAYQLYTLSCFHDPHATFGLDSSTEIMMIFQSITGGLARSVDYARFRSMIEGSPYFCDQFPFDKRLKQDLIFPNRIVVKAMGSDHASIGQNIVGGCIDEINFMAMTDSSKKTQDGGMYNQAQTIYNSLARRRKSRFMSQGAMPGILCLVSSKRYPGEFTDVKLEEAKSDPTIYVYDKRVWDVKPSGTFMMGWFKVFTGDATRKPRVLKLEEFDTLDEEDQLLTTEVPEEYRRDFEDDLMGALRDIAGVGTMARFPFIHNQAAVNASFGKGQSIFNVQETDLVTGEPLTFFPSRFSEPNLPRWLHVDIGITGDSLGLTIGHVPGFKAMERGGEIEHMPIIRVDGMLRVRPPKGGEILLYKLRELIYKLRDNGLNIRWVTADSFQSTDFLQVLRQKGMTTGLISMDRTNLPYDMLKNAFYDGRIEAPDHTHCQTELISLEKDLKTGKVDHTTSSTKDVADSLTGVAYGLTMRREIWAMFGVSFIKFAQGVQAKEPNLKEGVDGVSAMS